MRTPILLLAAPLATLFACGDAFDPADHGLEDLTCDAEPADACELYACALQGCYDDAALNRPSGSSTEELCGARDTGADDDYICAAEFWAYGDCSTTDGLSAVVIGDDQCGPAFQ